MNYPNFFNDAHPGLTNHHYGTNSFFYYIRKSFQLFGVLLSVLKKAGYVLLYGIIIRGYMGLFQAINIAYDHYEDQLHVSSNNLLKHTEDYIIEHSKTVITGLVDKNPVIITSACLQSLGDN